MRKPYQRRGGNGEAWYIDQRLREKLKLNPNADLAPYRDYYLAHIWDRAQYYNDLSKKVFGREVRHTLLVHFNLLNALFLDDLLTMFAKRGWKIINAREDFPELEEKINSGSLSLTAVSQAQTFFKKEAKSQNPLPREERKEILESLENQSSRQAEKILLSHSSQPATVVVEKARLVSETVTEIRFAADEALTLAEIRKQYKQFPRYSEVHRKREIQDFASDRGRSRISMSEIARKSIAKQNMFVSRNARVLFSAENHCAPNVSESRGFDSDCNRYRYSQRRSSCGTPMP